MKLLDTSVAVDHLSGLEAAVELLEQLVEGEEAPIAASELVRFELLAGVRETEVDALEEFLTVPAWIPVSEEVARLGGQLARSHRRSHSGIDDADYLIAATALLLDAQLITTNVRRIPMLAGMAAPY